MESNPPSTAAVPRTRPGDTSFQFEPSIPAWLLFSLSVLLVFSVIRSYRRTTRSIPVGKKILLGALRMTALAVALLCLARPTQVTRGEIRERGLCFVALDTSASMNIRDTKGSRTRWETAREIFSANSQALGQLSSEFELRRYGFDSTVREVPALPGEASGDALKPVGTGTDLAKILENVRSEAGGSPASGVLLVSDGRHNAPSDVVPVALALGMAGIPVYAIGLGQDATPADYKDIRIRQLIVPEKAFIGTSMVLRVEVESTLPAAVKVPLQVDVDGKEIYRRMLDLQPGPNASLPSIEIPYIPETLGVHRVIATIGTLPDEADISNNTRNAFFRVYRNKLGIWYIEGAIRKEFGAIRSALETAPNIDLKAIDAYTANALFDGEMLPANDEWSQYKLIIIGDLAARRFDRSKLARLPKFVEDGGAVLMVGGASNMGVGAWHESPLAPALPAEFSFDDGYQEGPFAIRVTEDEVGHPVLRLNEDPARNAELWRELPVLPGLYRYSGLRPAAHVLLRGGTQDLLVVQDYGKGRGALIASDLTWQWISKAGLSDTHKTFWRNLIAWLTRSDYRDNEKAVFADADRLQYLVGEEANFRIHVHETEALANRLKTAHISVSLSRIQGQSEQAVMQEDLGRGAGEYTKNYALGAPGGYRLRAEAIGAGGDVVDSDSVDFQVTAPDLEMDNPKANLKLLRRIAALSGGMYFDPEKSGQAFERLLNHPAGYSKPISEVVQLWSNEKVLAAFVFLVLLEWFLRRRWGLV